MSKIDRYTLKLRQSMCLDDKIRFTKRRIEEWIDYFGENKCYISFSGGKDSTVLLDLVRQVNPNIPAVFVDTGLEYPEIKQFVKTFDNVTILRPKKMFNEVVKDNGFPIISKEVSECIEQARIALERNNGQYQYRLDALNGNKKNKDGTKSAFNYTKWKFLLNAPFKISNKCCNIMKKTPVHTYYKQTGRTPIIATMTEESRLRESQYLRQGCNGFENKIPTSTPMAFWTEQDVLEYLYTRKLKYASVYGEIRIREREREYYLTGCKRTGCMFCGFGCHLEKEPNRFQMLKQTHPKQYEYIINTLGMGEVLDYIGVKY